MKSVPAVVLVICSLLLLAGCGGGGGGGGGNPGNPPPSPPPPATQGDYVVLATNDLGMHCVDADFSVFMMLPPFNVVDAEVVRVGNGDSPRLLGSTEAEVFYGGAADARGSINTTSLHGKSNFWSQLGSVFGVAEGEGLTGLTMPADAPAPGPQNMEWDATLGAFQAKGIPIFPRDDAGVTNPYPLLRIQARLAGVTAAVASIDTVVPVSAETDCQSCHITGGIAASAAGTTWSTDADPEVQARKNVLILHDRKNGSTLASSTPVLCFQCHYSAALDLAGTGPTGMQTVLPSFSRAMHAYHGSLGDGAGGQLFPSSANPRDNCYKCHPGAVTDCQRGAMRTGGLQCSDCHGDMLDVGGEDDLAAGGSIDGTNDGGARRPWMDLPRCQSCHTGDANSHLTGPDLVEAPDGIRLRRAFRTTDAAASPILATNQRFAENQDQLYRHSRGHGGLLCRSCHGSTHAIWPIDDPSSNDNLEAAALQGHSGTIIECAVCHGTTNLGNGLSGPHGMHVVNDASFTDHRHSSAYESNPAACRACHGQDLRGTVLSRTAATRTLRAEERTVTLQKGTPVGCNHCHGLPGAGGDDDDD
jgi:hypothetical protein